MVREISIEHLLLVNAMLLEKITREILKCNIRRGKSNQASSYTLKLSSQPYVCSLHFYLFKPSSFYFEVSIAVLFPLCSHTVSLLAGRAVVAEPFTLLAFRLY